MFSLDDVLNFSYSVPALFCRVFCCVVLCCCLVVFFTVICCVVLYCDFLSSFVSSCVVVCCAVLLFFHLFLFAVLYSVVFCRRLLSMISDQIGFHLYEYARHFLTTCHR